MSARFRLNALLDPAASADPRDTLKTKTALKKTGHYEPPDWGLHEFPDQRMFDGIKAFQKEQGLRVDGVMRPDGETAARLGDVLKKIPSTPQPQNGPAVRRETPIRPTPMNKHTAAGTEATRGIAPGEHDWMRDTYLDWGRAGSSRAASKTRPGLFDILHPVGHGRRNDPHDVLATRRAQHRLGVSVDGSLGKGGETAKAVEGDVRSNVQRVLQEQLETKRADPDAADETQVAMMERKPWHRQWGPEMAPGSRNATIGGSARALSTAAAAASVLSPHAKRLGAPGEVPESPDTHFGARRTDIADPPPPLPPFEPHDDPTPAKTEFPGEAPFKEMDLSNPIPDDIEPGIYVHPMPPEELTGPMILERRGSPTTQRRNAISIKEMLDALQAHEGVVSAVHVHGAESYPGGKRKRERLRRRIGELRGVRADGEIHVTLKDGREIHFHMQTADVYADGRLKPWEADAKHRIEQHDLKEGVEGVVIVFPKRPAMSDGEYQDFVRQQFRDELEKILPKQQ